MKFRTKTAVLLAQFLLLVSLGWPQASRNSTGKSVDQLGLQVQDQPSAQSSQGQAQKPDQKQDQQKPAEPSAQAPEQTISPKQAKELFKSVDEILKFASNDTGFPIEHEVKRKLIGRNEVESFLLKNMRDDKDAQRLERSAVVLKKFGLIPQNFDLPHFLVAMLKEQVAGYYDPKTKTVNLLNWLEIEQQKPVLAHELTHALQDQSFGLEKWMKVAEGNDRKQDPRPEDIKSDEELTARQAIVEGQAMAVLLDYTLAPTGQSLLDSPQIREALKEGMLVGTADSPTFRDAPIFLKETLTFPYRYGLDFTAALLTSGGKQLAYSAVFKKPPTTSREIMEPQTYIEGEKIEPLKMLDFAKDFKDYDWFDFGAMGEFDVAVLVEQYAGGDEAKVLYPEWRGGYYFAGRPKGDKSAPLGVLYVSRWASPASAAEFAAVYAKSFAQRYKRARALGPDGKVSEDAPPVDSWRTLRGRHAWLTEDGPVVIDVRGDTILISESLDDASTQRSEEDFFGSQK
jgi:hypothetical protein